eukprot:7282986-Alexandrium_andersonii.AAC.1
MKPPRPRRRKSHGRGFGRGVSPRTIRQSLRLDRQFRTLGICIGAPLGVFGDSECAMVWGKA